MNRRIFNKKILETVASFALIDTLFAYDAIGKPIKPITDHWALQLHEFCADLGVAAISPLQWQQKIEELYAKVELSELLEFINFHNLIKGFKYPDLGVATKSVSFPRLNELPERTAFVKKIFGMKKDRTIIPHGHSNMASAHMVLSGEMHLRHYEKVQQDNQHLIIQPTVDRMARPGESSSISDEKDNVHWFIANTATAFTFDVIMLDLNNESYDIHNLDIYESVDLNNGTQRVPIINVETALRKYGKQHH